MPATNLVAGIVQQCQPGIVTMHTKYKYYLYFDKIQVVLVFCIKSGQYLFSFEANSW